jgi:Sugar-binding N-terminal domain
MTVERQSPIKIGVIGDDLTGSSDIANTLAKAGARTIQTIGVPKARLEPGFDAAIGAGCQADPVQILLDLRFHA